MRIRAHLLHGNPEGAFHGRRSRFYNLVATRLLRRFYRRLARDIAELAPQGAAVLDIGTGPGVLLAELAQLRPDLALAGIDLSEDMVTAARRNLAAYADRVTVQAGDVRRLPLADRSFDLVVSSFSLHHWEDPQAAVPELARVLRPSGRVHVYDFRFAPFDQLTAAAQTRSVLTAQAPQRTPIRIGTWPLPRCVRFTMSG
ncbi:MAG TPA: class I SAM-dependent methyltransferase [Micromonosporaceae bacterium]|nr:class I SAM-dependent methyltransferase [Micromonosporaceae bacterium]